VKKIVVLFIPIFAVFGCCIWQGFAYGMSDLLTSRETITTEEYLKRMYKRDVAVPSDITDFQGIQVGMVADNYYLHYKAEKKFVLNMIDSMPYNEPEAGVGDYYPSIDCMFEGDYRYITNEPLIFFQTLNDLSDVNFWRPEQIKEGEYYYCLKEPWRHTILFDKKSQTVYSITVQDLH
jgi:hypothetical protein